MRRLGGRDLARVDQALLRLRRMWDAPRGIAHEGGVVEGSTLLVCLAVADTAGAVGVAEVADALGVAPSTASRLVARAAEAGMVTREVSTTDSWRRPGAIAPHASRSCWSIGRPGTSPRSPTCSRGSRTPSLRRPATGLASDRAVPAESGSPAWLLQLHATYLDSAASADAAESK